MAPKASASDKKAGAHLNTVNTANTVTKDFLIFSQPFIHEGALLSSTSSGRRLYIHHLSEVPLSEVYTTRVGNQLQRIDKAKVTMGGLDLKIEPLPSSANVPTAKVLSQIPTAAFTGSPQGRDKMVLQLLQKGKDANAAGDYALACGCFEAAYALSVRAGMLVSAANMRLKLDDSVLSVLTAEAMYRQVLGDSGLLAAERQMATRKLQEAQELLKSHKGSGSDGGARAGGVGGGGFEADFGGGGGGGFTADFGNGGGGGGGGFEADFGGGDEADFDDGFGDFDDAPPPRPKALAAAPSPPLASAPPASAASGGGGFASFGDGGGADDDFDDDAFDAEFEAEQARRDSSGSAVSGSAVSGSAATPPPPAAPPPGGGGFASFGAEDSDHGFASFDSAPAAPAAKPAAPSRAAHAIAPSAMPSLAGGGAGGPSSAADGEAVRKLEARLAALEEAVRGGPSKLAVFENQQKVDALTAQVESTAACRTPRRKHRAASAAARRRASPRAGRAPNAATLLAASELVCASADGDGRPPLGCFGCCPGCRG